MDKDWDYIVVGAGPAGLALAAGLSAKPENEILVLQLADSSAEPRAAVRPHVLEFDGWAKHGAQGWAPEQILPHFKSVENDLDFGSLRYHGAEGILQLKRSSAERWSPLDRGFREAALEAGHPWAPDHNAPGVLGVSPLAWSQKENNPAGPESSMRSALEASGNVTFCRVDAVDRLLWNGNHAEAVRVRTGSLWKEISSAEIVLCAGGIESPCILQRSGIGPAAELRSVGIEVLHELPVGSGLQVHPQLRIILNPGEPTDADLLGGMLARWNTGLEGTSSGDLMAWTRNGPAASRGSGLVGALAQVFSRGTVLVAGQDPESSPVVESGMLADSLDGYRFRLIYRHLSDLLERPALAHYLSGATDRNGDPWRPKRDAADLEGWLRTSVESMGDYAAGCRMGMEGNPAAVVDGSGSVLGVHGVRVADSSISPNLVRAAPLLIDSVIGSRVAQRILESTFPQRVGNDYN